MGVLNDRPRRSKSANRSISDFARRAARRLPRPIWRIELMITKHGGRQLDGSVTASSLRRSRELRSNHVIESTTHLDRGSVDLQENWFQVPEIGLADT